VTTRITSQRATGREWAGLAVLALPTLLLSVGPVVTLSVSLILGAAPAARADSAAALNETSSQLGFALGIAILGSVAAALYRDHIAPALPSELPGASAAGARDTLAGALAAARYLSHPAAAALLESARGAYTAGLHGVAVISAVLLAVIAPGVLMMLRHCAPYRQATMDDIKIPAESPVL
jgi:MFS transporter, DHA2 family, multidrug resistance protein